MSGLGRTRSFCSVYPAACIVETGHRHYSIGRRRRQPEYFYRGRFAVRTRSFSFSLLCDLRAKRPWFIFCHKEQESGCWGTSDVHCFFNEHLVRNRILPVSIPLSTAEA